MIENKTLGSDVYTDFSGFESMRKAARANSPEAVGAVAKQLEGMFLNMMLSSMREANQLFNEDSLLSSKEVRFYQQMLDQQLSTTLSEGKGLGLAETIKRQLSAVQERRYDPDAVDQQSPDGREPNAPQGQPLQADQPGLSVERYRVMALPPISQSDPVQDNTDSGLIDPVQQAAESGDVEQTDFSPLSPGEFVEQILPFARRSAEELGIPVESIVAQAALETGWGQYLMKHDDGRHAFNFFGIKAGNDWQGDKVDVMTVEYRNGIAAKETAAFRSYATMDEAFQDYTRFLSQKERYQPALQSVRENQDAKSWGNHLQLAGYATDPNYGKKIASIVSRLQKDGASQEKLTLSRAP